MLCAAFRFGPDTGVRGSVSTTRNSGEHTRWRVPSTTTQRWEHLQTGENMSLELACVHAQSDAPC